MDKVENHEKIVKIKTHTFYCDICNKLIGKSEEEDDGYYKELGEYELGFHLPKIGFFDLHKNLCDECKEKFVEKIKTSLLDLGFVFEV